MRLVCACLGLVIVACGGATTRPTPLRNPDLAEEITDSSYPEARRVFDGMRLDEPARNSLRNLIVRYLNGRTQEILRDGDYDDVVEQFARVTALFSPEDFAHARLVPELAPIAHAIVDRGSPRGDEGRVLSALLVLHSLDEEHGGYDAQYREVADWSRQARATIPSVVERFSRLIDVWEVHSTLTPAPEVLQFLARLHIERRNFLARLLDGGGAGSFFGGDFHERQSADLLLRRAPLDVAAVYLQQGDIASAATVVRSMGSLSPAEIQFVEIVQVAASPSEDGTEAVLELADAYRRARPEVAQGLCRVGHRRAPTEPRYPLCLARVALVSGDFLEATAWFAEAIRLSPESRDYYDEALQQIRAQLDLAEAGSTSDIAALRGMAHEAERILELRNERWPGNAGLVSAAELHLIMGVLEKQAGNLNEAGRRFRASIEAEQTLPALLELASLEERTGEPREATRLYRQALDQLPAVREADGQRAEILEHLGDSYRRQHLTADAVRMYEQTVSLLDQLERHPRDLRPAYILLRRGIVQSRLGRFDQAKRDFLAAIQAGPDNKSTYVTILSHLVVAQPDPAFASEVFRSAQRQTSLEPEWRVYMALWMGLIASRAGVAPTDGVNEILRELSGNDAWWGRLARFATGNLPYGELLAAASGPGEQAEAHFYEAARLLSERNEQAARAMFEAVVRTHMVSFYEFAMAQELLQAVGP